MQLQGEKPIFLQLAEQLEDGILSGAYPEGSQVPSITEYAATYKINPATALKGINLLVNAGLLLLDGELRETQTTDYFSKHRRSDCAVRELTAR